MRRRQRWSAGENPVRFETLESRLVLTVVVNCGYESMALKQAVEALVNPNVETPDLSQITNSLERVIYHHLNPGGIELVGLDLAHLQMFGPGETHIPFLSPRTIAIIHQINPGLLVPGVYEASLKLDCGCSSNGFKPSNGGGQAGEQEDPDSTMLVMARMEGAPPDGSEDDSSLDEMPHEGLTLYDMQEPVADGTMPDEEHDLFGALLPYDEDFLDWVPSGEEDFAFTTASSNLQIDQMFADLDQENLF